MTTDLLSTFSLPKKQLTWLGIPGPLPFFSACNIEKLGDNARKHSSQFYSQPCQPTQHYMLFLQHVPLRVLLNHLRDRQLLSTNHRLVSEHLHSTNSYSTKTTGNLGLTLLGKSPPSLWSLKQCLNIRMYTHNQWETRGKINEDKSTAMINWVDSVIDSFVKCKPTSWPQDDC